ncbi:MAG: FlgD immunoglobulin-like domain containing protein, partial [Planctomycetota bacterium]
MVLVVILGGAALWFFTRSEQETTEKPRVAQGAGNGTEEAEEEETAGSDGPAEEGLSFTYELEEPGQVSAAIYNAKGEQVRNLFSAKQQEAGSYTVFWDGLDREGNPQPAGEYTWKLLRTDGFTSRFITSVGVNPEIIPHKWPGNHRPSSMVCLDRYDNMYVGAEKTEGPPVTIRQSLDGTTQHWTNGRGPYGMRWNGPVEMENAHTYLFQRHSCGKLFLIDPSSGHPIHKLNGLYPGNELPDDGEPGTMTHAINIAANDYDVGPVLYRNTFDEDGDNVNIGDDPTDAVDLFSSRIKKIKGSGEASIDEYTSAWDKAYDSEV